MRWARGSVSPSASGTSRSGRSNLMENLHVILNHATQKFRVVHNGKLLGRVDEVEQTTVKHPLVCKDCRSVVDREIPVIRGFLFKDTPGVTEKLVHPTKTMVFEMFLVPSDHS